MACTTSGELYIDDNLIEELYIDDQKIDYLEIDGVCVWSALLPGMIIFDVPGNFTWTIPSGLNEVHVLMIGGGGVGKLDPGDPSQSTANGGGAGQTIEDSAYEVTPGTEVTVKVGEGGVHGTNFASDSSFDTLIAAAGGRAYKGNGDTHESPFGTVTDGVYHATSKGSAYGGQAGWGDGGDGASCDCCSGEDAQGVGSGGGGAIGDNDCPPFYYGSGGRGEVRVAWKGQDILNPPPDAPLVQVPGHKVYKVSEMTQAQLNKFKIRRI